MVIFDMVVEFGVARKLRWATPTCESFSTLLLDAGLFDLLLFCTLLVKAGLFCKAFCMLLGQAGFLMLLCDAGLSGETCCFGETCLLLLFPILLPLCNVLLILLRERTLRTCICVFFTRICVYPFANWYKELTLFTSNDSNALFF